MKHPISLSQPYAQLSEFIEKKGEGKYWLWKLAIFCAVLSWCLAVPPYTVIKGSDAWAFIEIQAADLLHPHDYEVYIRRENMVMRWMLPVVYYVTGHSILLVLVIQGILGVLFLYLISKEIFRQTNDKVLTVFFTLGISNLFVFSWFFVDTAGYGDAYAYFFLLLALLVRHPALLFVCLQFAFFTDERAVIASGYVVLWWMTRSVIDNDQKGGPGFMELVKSAFSRPVWVVWVALVAYIVFRRYIMSTYFPGHSYTTMGTPVLFSDVHRWGLGNSLWTSFEGTWLLLGTAGFVLWRAGWRWHFLALLVGFAVLIITGILVHDVDRAYGYGFPFLLMSSLILSHMIPLAEFRKLVFIMAVVCIVSPMCYTLGYNKVVWAEPLPMKAMMALDQVLGWHWFD